MQAQPKDELYHLAVADVARDWDETTTEERARLLRQFPELAAMGLKLDAPFADPAAIARQQETDAQLRILDGTAAPE